MNVRVISWVVCAALMTTACSDAPEEMLARDELEAASMTATASGEATRLDDAPQAANLDAPQAADQETARGAALEAPQVENQDVSQAAYGESLETTAGDANGGSESIAAPELSAGAEFGPMGANPQAGPSCKQVERMNAQNEIGGWSCYDYKDAACMTSNGGMKDTCVNGLILKQVVCNLGGNNVCSQGHSCAYKAQTLNCNTACRQDPRYTGGACIINGAVGPDYCSCS